MSEGDYNTKRTIVRMIGAVFLFVAALVGMYFSIPHAGWGIALAGMLVISIS